MIFIDWIVKLIDKIPDILLFIVPGYIFVSIFNFILFKDKRNDENSQTNFIILKSISISYIFKLFLDKIKTITCLSKCSIDDSLNAIILVVACLLISYVTALICRTKSFNKFLLKIGIRRTINSDIWLDIVSDGCWLRVFSKDEQKSYLGQCRFHESHKNEPIIVLIKYQILDEYNDVICDYSNNVNRKIVLNLKDFERVEVVDTI